MKAGMSAVDKTQDCTLSRKVKISRGEKPSNGHGWILEITNMCFDQRPYGVFPYPAQRLGGGGRSICQTAGPILDPKTSLDSPGLVLSEYIAKFYFKVTDDVNVWAKVLFYYLSSLSSQGKTAVSYWVRADETAFIVPGIILSNVLSPKPNSMYWILSLQ